MHDSGRSVSLKWYLMCCFSGWHKSLRSPYQTPRFLADVLALESSLPNGDLDVLALKSSPFDANPDVLALESPPSDANPDVLTLKSPPSDANPDVLMPDSKTNVGLDLNVWAMAIESELQENEALAVNSSGEAAAEETQLNGKVDKER